MNTLRKMDLEPLNLELLQPALLNVDPSFNTTKLLYDNDDGFRQPLQPTTASCHFLSPRKRKLLHACAKGNIDTVRDLVQDEKVSPNFYNYDKRTPLHLAAAEGHLEIAQILVEAGASLTTYDRWGCTPLFDAVHGKHQRLTQYFFDTMQSNIDSTNITRRHSTSCATPLEYPHSNCRDSVQQQDWKSSSAMGFKRELSNDAATLQRTNQEKNQNRTDNSNQSDDTSITLLQKINEEYTRKQRQLLQIFQRQKQNLFHRRLSRNYAQLED
jgi:hypothetical protein